MPGLVHIQTTINDDQVDRQSLLEVLRDVLGWTGTIEGATTASVVPVPSNKSQPSGDDRGRRSARGRRKTATEGPDVGSAAP